MNKTCICTIVSTDFVSNGIATLSSMKKYNENSDFYLLNVPSPNQPDFKGSFEDFKVLNKHFIKEYDLINLNNDFDNDRNRWSLKPFLIKELLKKYEKVIYVDPDLYFVSDWSFLLDEIDGLLLTRHWRSLTPSYKNFIVNFTHGFFNAGFIGASKKSFEALEWWANCCLWKCEVNIGIGLYVDQKYLDFIHMHFDNVNVCKHKGCNLASWNDIELKKEFVNDKPIVKYKDEEWDAVFFHFSHLSDNPCLLKYYEKYIDKTEEIRSKLRNVN